MNTKWMLVLMTLVGASSAAVWVSLLPAKPTEFQGKEGCYIREINDTIAFEETITPLGTCLRIHCSKGMISYASCGVVNTSDANCHVTEVDTKQPYPDCCPDILCDEDNNRL